jgi:hypothetical protein
MSRYDNILVMDCEDVTMRKKQTEDASIFVLCDRIIQLTWNLMQIEMTIRLVVRTADVIIINLKERDVYSPKDIINILESIFIEFETFPLYK